MRHLTIVERDILAAVRIGGPGCRADLWRRLPAASRPWKPFAAGLARLVSRGLIVAHEVKPEPAVYAEPAVAPADAELDSLPVSL